MKLAWTSRAVGELARLHDFLAPVNQRAAARVLQSLVKVAGRLPDQPRLGARLDQYDPRELRRLLVGRYELRYEVGVQEVIILRIWHSREDR
jgi:plasmid stabilization system protein ParE